MSVNKIDWPNLGNEKVLDFLSRVLKNKQTASAYLFLGADDIGKSTIAFSFARALIGLEQAEESGFNSDLHVLSPEEGKHQISLDQIREFIKTLSLSSFLNSYQVGIIKDAHQLRVDAQNALLKTLEEPKDKVVIILLANSEENFLSTILSRVQKLYFYPVPSEKIYDYLSEELKTKRSLAKDLAHLSLGRPLKAVQFLEDPEAYQRKLEQIKIILDSFHLTLNERVLSLDKLMNDRTYSPQAINLSTEILDIYTGLLRDLLFIHLNQSQNLQFIMYKEELEALSVKLKADLAANSPSDIEELFLAWLLERFKLIEQARDYLAGKLNPRLVLEQFLINLL